MRWQDEGLLLNVIPHGERSAILKVFTANYGLSAGLVRNAYSKRMSYILQPSSHLMLSWDSRLEENLGNFKVELIKTRTDVLISNRMGLAAFNSLASLCMATLAERDPMPNLYQVTQNFLDSIRVEDNWEFFYLKWELEFLSCLGFGLDLAKCAVSGSTDNLAYVSPKSGKAVSKKIGLDYHSKLLPLPKILLTNLNSNSMSHKDLVQGLMITGFFIEKWLNYSLEIRKVLTVRKRLLDALWSK